jgi:cell fate regulator YaaT (PSP1 superfamily)
MQAVKVQFAPWDKAYYFHANGFDLAIGEFVVVKTEMGTEVGRIAGFEEISEFEFVLQPEEPDGQSESQVESGSDPKEARPDGLKSKKIIKPIVRKAGESDLAKLPGKGDIEKALNYCARAKDKYDLPMKFVDAHYAYDGSKITFAFIADGRVDFRELVKDLTRHFGRTIRLQQIGIRDEAKIMGDFGHCGKPLCCKFLPELTSITSEMADCQQCAHRGSDRISGVCGRLMCCLAYEQEAYEELASKLPDIGSEIKYEGKKGKVIGHHLLRQTVNVEFRGGNGDEGRTILEIDPKKADKRGRRHRR